MNLVKNISFNIYIKDKRMITKIALAGILTTGAFFSGLAAGVCLRDKKILDKIKKLTIKKNTSASSKNID